MHFALVTHGLPQPSSNGGPMTCWAITDALLAAGHRVTVVSLSYPGDPFNTPDRQARLLDLGVDVQLVEAPTTRAGKPQKQWIGSRLSRLSWALREVVRPDLASFLPTVALAPRMNHVLEHVKPDAMFVYHWDSLAAVQGLGAAPRMAGVGDPWHLPNLRRWQHAAPRPTLSYMWWTLRTLRDARHCPGVMVRLLNDCEGSGCFQAQAATWLRRKGAAHCVYLRSPLVDSCGDDWQRRRLVTQAGNKPRILLGPSNLETTSTSAGLRLFAKQILPRLEHELGPDGFEVHIVGEGQPPKELARILPRPSVRLRGRVEPADAEFLSADVQLVPTPFVLGIRLRIITGFSFGTCVVAHHNEAANIPEMIHGENALLAPDGAGLAAAIVRVFRDHNLRERLGFAARLTYERYFTPEVAASPIVAELERLGANRKDPRESLGMRGGT